MYLNILKKLMPVLFVIGITVSAVSGPAMAAAELASHRAFYSVSMAPDSGSSTIAGVDGAMTMSLEKTCDGWIFTQDMSTVITLQDGSDVKQTALFTSWESLDGMSYRFASRFATGNGQSMVRGNANLNPEGDGEAHYSEPTEVRVVLPQGTLFPVSHTAWVIDEAELGSRSASRVVFTGTEELEPELVNAFIGNPVEADAHEFSGIDDLGSTRGWPLTMAFHSMASQSGVPSFEMWALQLDNGIAPSLRMNFGEFATVMTVKRLERLETPACG